MRRIRTAATTGQYHKRAHSLPLPPLLFSISNISQLVTEVGNYIERKLFSWLLKRIFRKTNGLTTGERSEYTLSGKKNILGFSFMTQFDNNMIWTCVVFPNLKYCFTYSFFICRTWSIVTTPAQLKFSLYWLILMDSSHSDTDLKGEPSEPLVLGRRMDTLHQRKEELSENNQHTFPQQRWITEDYNYCAGNQLVIKTSWSSPGKRQL